MPRRAPSSFTWSRILTIELGAVVAHDLGLRRIAEYAPHRRVQDEAELAVRAFRRANRLIEFERIDDPVTQEGIDVEPAAVGPEHFLFRRLDDEDAIVEIDDLLDERNLEMKPRPRDQSAARHGLAKAKHKRLLRLLHREHRPHRDDQKRDGADDQGDRARPHLRAPSADLSGRAPSGR